MIILGVIYIVWYVYFYPTRREMDRFPNFRMYYEAAGGNYQWRPKVGPESEGFAWCHADYLSLAFLPFRLVSFRTASIIWFLIGITNYIFLAQLLMGLPYGWILVIAYTKAFAVLLWSGNLGPLLCGLCISGPVGACVASLFKPYLWPFVFVHLFKSDIGIFLVKIAGA